MALFSTISRLVGLGRAITQAEVEPWEWEDRRVDYAFWDGYYRNTVYDTQGAGGFREIILKEVLGVDCDYTTTEVRPKLIGHFNPIKQIVDVYQNMMPGQYGADGQIGIADKVDGRDVNPVLFDPTTDPLGKLWRQSNLDTEKQELQKTGALLGTVGIRAVAQTGDSPRVFLDFDHPSRIVDYEEDTRGNVTRVRLEYVTVMGFAKAARDVEVIEEFDREGFSVKYNGKEQLDDEGRRNVMGFVPYVIYRHKGTKGFGRPCHDGTLALLDAINWTTTNQGESIYEHQWPQWFLTASGPSPESIMFGRARVWYVPTQADGPIPSATAIVPQIDNAAVSKFIEDRKREVRERQPEMALGSLDTLSGLSGESYAKLLLAAEERVLAARVNLQHALKRAIQMAFSYQIMLRISDFGTGMGTREAGDRAFADGKLDFEWKSQSALPLTAADKQQQIELDTARRTKDLADAATAQRLGLPGEEWMRLAGYDDQRIAELLTIKRTVAVIPTEDEAE